MVVKLSYSAKWQRAARSQHRKERRCGCGRERWEGYRKCLMCLIQSRVNSRIYRRRVAPHAIALGFCSRCLIREAMPDHANCGMCAEYLATRRGPR